MADVIIDESGLQNIANSLRNKLNTNNTFLPSEMGPAISNISGGETTKLQDGSGFFSNGARLSDINNLIVYFDNSITNMSQMFYRCINLFNAPSFNTPNLTNMSAAFSSCYNLVDVPQYNTTNLVDISRAFISCNNLSNASIQNIINMCLNSNITNTTKKTLLNSNVESPLYFTNIDNSMYSNRLSELSAAGWSY